jgi:hypothetical protein
MTETLPVARMRVLRLAVEPHLKISDVYPGPQSAIEHLELISDKAF